MKFSAAAVAITTLYGVSAAAVKRDAPTYSLLSVHSGNPSVHLRSLGVSPNGHIAIGGETALEVSPDGKFLNVVESSEGYKYIGIEGDSLVASEKYATAGFGFVGSPNQALTFNGKQSFIACPTGKYYEILADGSCEGGVGIDILAFASSN